MLVNRWNQTDKGPWEKSYKWRTRVLYYKHPDYQFQPRKPGVKRSRPGGRKEANQARDAANDGQGLDQARLAEGQHQAVHPIVQEPAEQRGAGQGVNRGSVPIPVQYRVPDTVNSPAQALAYNPAFVGNPAGTYNPAFFGNPAGTCNQAFIGSPVGQYNPAFVGYPTGEYSPALDYSPAAVYNPDQTPVDQPMNLEAAPVLNPAPALAHDQVQVAIDSPDSVFDSGSSGPSPDNEPIDFEIDPDYDFLDFDFTLDSGTSNPPQAPVDDGEPSSSVQHGPIVEEQHSVAMTPAASKAIEQDSAGSQDISIDNVEDIAPAIGDEFEFIIHGGSRPNGAIRRRIFARG